MRVIRLSLVSVLIVVVLGAPASAGRQGPTWSSSTDGLPVSTLAGQWTTISEREVHLDIAGGHAAGAKTTFEASWVSPYTSKGEVPEYSGGLFINSMNELGDDIYLKDFWRFRYKGEEWSPWFRERFKLRPGWTGMGFSMGFMSFSEDQVKFEWRLKGTIIGTAEIDGYADFWVN